MLHTGAQTQTGIAPREKGREGRGEGEGGGGRAGREGQEERGEEELGKQSGEQSFPPCLVFSEVPRVRKSTKPPCEDNTTLPPTTKGASGCRQRWRTAEGDVTRVKIETSKKCQSAYSNLTEQAAHNCPGTVVISGRCAMRPGPRGGPPRDARPERRRGHSRCLRRSSLTCSSLKELLTPLSLWTAPTCPWVITWRRPWLSRIPPRRAKDGILKRGRSEEHEPSRAAARRSRAAPCSGPGPPPHAHRNLASRFQFQSAKATSQSPPLLSASGD